MVRLFATLALFSILVLPSEGSAGDMYSFIDADGVIRVTNVPPSQKAPVPGALRSFRNVRSPRGTTTYDEHICAAAEKHGVAPPLLKAVVAVESNFNPAAISAKGATGLMQLMPTTARDLYVDDLLDPAQNIHGGARYLRLLQDQFKGDLEKVLAAYNAGPEAVRRAGGSIPPFPETRAYVRRVLAVRASYMGTPWCDGGRRLLTMR
jgi:soluble lytic murein transglycosylase-like protein